MRTVDEIVTDIEELYPTYKLAEKQLKSYKEALKHHHTVLTEEAEDPRVLSHGMLLHYKKKPKYKWKFEAFNEELEDMMMMHLAKKMEKHHVNAIEYFELDENGQMKVESMDVFSLKPEQYVRPYAKKRPQIVVDLEKSELQELTDSLKETDFEDALTSFKLKKMDYTMLDNTYQELRKELLASLLDENSSSVKCEIGTLKVMDSTPDYDFLAMMDKQFIKQLSYTLTVEDNFVKIYDHFSNEWMLATEDSFSFLDHHFLFNEKGITVDNQLLSSTTKNKLLMLGRATNDFKMVLQGVTTITGESLLRQLPFSTGKVEKMIDKGYLHPNTLSTYRYIEKLEDYGATFEIIEEASHNQRVEMFLTRNMRRAQNLRQMNDKANDTLHAMYQEAIPQIPEFLTFVYNEVLHLEESLTFIQCPNSPWSATYERQNDSSVFCLLADGQSLFTSTYYVESRVHSYTLQKNINLFDEMPSLQTELVMIHEKLIEQHHQHYYGHDNSISS